MEHHGCSLSSVVHEVYVTSWLQVFHHEYIKMDLVSKRKDAFLTGKAKSILRTVDDTDTRALCGGVRPLAVSPPAPGWW